MSYKIKKTEEKEGSVVEIHIEIPREDLMSKWDHSLKHVGEQVKIDGFRPGKAPENVLISKVGEMNILEKAAEMAINDAYGEILKEKGHRVLGLPKVVITKIAKGDDLEATIQFSLFPKVELPDYKKIAKKSLSKKESVEVTEKEIEEVIEEIKKFRKHNHKDHDHKEGEKCEDENFEINDEFVKTLGHFKDVEDFKAKIKENIALEKTQKSKEKSRIAALEDIRKDSKIDVPNVLVENELQRMINEFSFELSRGGTTLEKYLGEIKKTEEHVKKEWAEKAKERVQNELILLQISRDEKLNPKVEDVEREVAKMKEQYPTADLDRMTAFVEDVLAKEEVFRFLESL